MSKVEIVESTCERLNYAFNKSSLKQVDLVRITGIDKSSISLYLSGKVTPKGDKLYKLALALGVSPVWLSGFNVPMVETKNSPGVEEKTPRERKYQEIINLLEALPEEKLTEALRYLKYLADN
jgi:transcriptional regulator with XRE-family HTH domain